MTYMDRLAVEVQNHTRGGWHLNRGISLILLAVALIVGAFFWHASSSPQSVPVQLARVIDGDSIRVVFRGENTPVRLLGIDCVEMRNTNKRRKQMKEYGLTEEQALMIGRLASEATEDALKPPAKIRVVLPEAKAERDRYGRLLAYVEADGGDLGMKLIEAGLADVFDARHARESVYLEAREGARNQGLGIWANSLTMAPQTGP